MLRYFPALLRRDDARLRGGDSYGISGVNRGGGARDGAWDGARDDARDGAWDGGRDEAREVEAREGDGYRDDTARDVARDDGARDGSGRWDDDDREDAGG